MSTTKELQMGVERRGNATSQKLEMPICGSRFGRIAFSNVEIERNIVEVEHVKAHRTKNDKNAV